MEYVQQDPAYSPPALMASLVSLVSARLYWLRLSSAALWVERCFELKLVFVWECTRPVSGTSAR